ncbi:hypothetical protein [Sphingomonas jaspsi]|uniref:hypothetical protein n=1 Tax=Sphingomonas jaspsi TaxID=392409 RepID=UPI0004B9DFB1|nr:hypothetical protein [Sphingomonas jaspsi]
MDGNWWRRSFRGNDRAANDSASIARQSPGLAPLERIAALAVTGSPSRAARAIGKHAFGAEQLRTARGGQSFAAAWDAAIEISRERELVHFSTGLANLAREEERRLAAMDIAVRPAGPIVSCDEEEEVREATARIRLRLTKARRLFLLHIAGDAKKRRAWEVLVGKPDWKRAERGDPQPGDIDEEEIMALRFIEQGMPNLGKPDMVVTAAAGFLPEVTGGPDAMQPYRDLVGAFGKKAADLTPEEKKVVADYADLYRQNGWLQHKDGSWYLPLLAPEMRPSILQSRKAQASDRPRSRPSANRRRMPASGSARPNPTDVTK